MPQLWCHFWILFLSCPLIESLPQPHHVYWFTRISIRLKGRTARWVSPLCAVTPTILRSQFTVLIIGNKDNYQEWEWTLWGLAQFNNISHWIINDERTSIWQYKCSQKQSLEEPNPLLSFHGLVEFYFCTFPLLTQLKYIQPREAPLVSLISVSLEQSQCSWDLVLSLDTFSLV